MQNKILSRIPKKSNLGSGRATAFSPVDPADDHNPIVNILNNGQRTFEEGITASASSDQAGAVVLSNEKNIIATVGSAGDSVKLDTIFGIGAEVVIVNSSGTSMDVFPALGGNIGAGVNTAVAVAGGTTLNLLRRAVADTFIAV